MQTGQIRPQLKSTNEIHASISVPKHRTQVNLEQFLVEDVKPREVSAKESQTDAMRTPPPSPPYRPRKVGMDAEAQVVNDMVFSFDADCEPLVQLLIGSTCEQALVEVREDERLKNMVAAKEGLARRGDDLDSKMAARIAVERDLAYKKERVLLDAQSVMAKEAAVQAMLAATAVASQFLGRLQDDMLGVLETRHVLPDPVRAAVEHDFFGWLQQKVSLRLSQTRGSSMAVEDILARAVERFADEAARTNRDRAEAEAAESKAHADGEREAVEGARKRRHVKLFIQTDLSRTPFGPIELPGSSTVQSVEDELLKLLAERLGEENVPSSERVSFKWRGRVLDKDAGLFTMDLAADPDLKLAIAPLPPGARRRASQEAAASAAAAAAAAGGGALEVGAGASGEDASAEAHDTAGGEEAGAEGADGGHGTDDEGDATGEGEDGAGDDAEDGAA